MAHDCPKYRLSEELFNAISHGVGALVAIVGTVFLLLRSTDGWQAVSASIYGGALVLMFLMSCLYHTLTAPKAKYVFRVFDHAAVALLIAGTYTPYTLITLRGVLGWVIFGVVWVCTILTIVFNAVDIERFKKLCLAANIVSGWCIVVAVRPLLAALSAVGLWYLLAGGVAYTVGILFYRMKKVAYTHAIWHLFVLLGAVLQYVSLYAAVFG